MINNFPVFKTVTTALKESSNLDLNQTYQSIKTIRAFLTLTPYCYLKTQALPVE